MKPVILLILVSFSFDGVLGQSLSGTVTDAVDGEPLVGANVYSKSDWRKGTSTDVYGRFTLEGTITGDTLVLSFIGYQERYYVVTSLREVTITLSPQTLNMSAVVVEAEYLAAEEFTYKKINRLDIYMDPNAKADPLLAVNSLPSSTTLDESANVSFRGSSPAETGIFFNNVPLYDAVRFSQLNGIGTFGIFNTAIVDEMLVFPGNPPLEYGNTTSGLIAIKTTENIPEMSTNIATVSLASYGLFTNRPAGKHSAITVFSNYQPSAVLKGLNPEAFENIESFNSADLGVNFLHRFNDKTILKIFNYSLAEGYDVNFRSPTYAGLFQQEKQRNFTVTNFRKRIKQSEITLNSNASFTRSDFGYADTDITLNNFDGFFSANYQYFHSNFNVKTGLTLDYRWQKFNGIFYTFDFAEGPGYPTTTGRSTAETNRPEIYLYTRYYWGKRVTIGGGLRKNLPTQGQKHYLSGQLNTKFELNKKTNLVLAWGKYHKYDLSQSGGDDQQESTIFIESDQISLDMNWKKKSLEFTAALFGKRTRDASGTTEIAGLEAFIDGPLLPKLSGQLSYTLIHGRTTTDEGEEYPSAYDLNYFIRGNLEYRFSTTWSMNTTFLTREGQYYQPVIGASFNPALNVFMPQRAGLSQQERLPRYSIINLSVSRLIPINERFSVVIFGSCSNVLDTKNVRTYTYDFDYTSRSPEYFSLRTAYFGAVINF